MKFYLLIALSLLLLALAGCNLFAPLISAERTSDSPEGLVEEGKKYMREGNAPKALEYFNRAIVQDSMYSDAWYYRSKMVLRIGDVLVPMLWSEIKPTNPDGSRDSNKVPFFPKDTTWAKAIVYANRVITEPDRNNPGSTVTDTINITNADTLFNHYSRLYGPSMEAYLCLKWIWDGFAPRGTMNSSVIRADYLFLSSLFTSFITCDVNLDYRLDTSYIDNKERQAYTIFAKSFTDIHNIHLNADEVYGIYTVKDINKSIDSILNSTNITLNVLNSLDGEIQTSKYSDSNDLSMLKDPRKQLQDMVQQAGFYYYNDSKDNDFDWYDTDGDGKQKKMIWIDINNDKRITLNLADSAGSIISCDSAHFYDATNLLPTSIIGGPDPEQANLPLLFKGSSYGYRIVGTTKHYFYCGPLSGEFVAGDYGVDEEKLDNKNNDGDMNGTNGLKDEDTRITPDSLDEDGDYVEFSAKYPLSNFGTALAPKIYSAFIITWDGGYINRRTAFTQAQAQSLTRIYDDFGNGYRVFKFFDSQRVKAVMDSVVPAYSTQMPIKFGDTVVVRAEWTGKPLHDAIIWNDADNDGMIDNGAGGHFSYGTPAGNIASLMQRNLPDSLNPLPQGEFIGGDWGVDEEVYDGCDNDGDGKIDEDGDRKWFEPAAPLGTATQTYQRPCP